MHLLIPRLNIEGADHTSANTGPGGVVHPQRQQIICRGLNVDLFSSSFSLSTEVNGSSERLAPQEPLTLYGPGGVVHPQRQQIICRGLILPAAGSRAPLWCEHAREEEGKSNECRQK